MELNVSDWAALAAVVVFAAVGVFRGLSGELAALAGIAAAVLAVYFGYGPLLALLGDVAPSVAAYGRPAGFAVAGLAAIVAFGAANFAVRRFVSFLVPQPTNAILGAAAGGLKGLAFAAAVLATGALPEPAFPAFRSSAAFVASLFCA